MNDMKDIIRSRPILPIRKRKRVVSACNRCRARKAKCSGGYPCSRCEKDKADCDMTKPKDKDPFPADQKSKIDCLNAYRCKLERVIQYLFPEVSLAYLRSNIDVFERNVCINKKMVALSFEQLQLLSNSSNSNIAYPVESGILSKHFDSELASTTDKSFMKFFDASKRVNNDKELNITSGSKNDAETLSYAKSEALSDTALRECLDILPSDMEVLNLVQVFIRICETNYFYLSPKRFQADVEKFLKERSLGNFAYANDQWAFIVTLLSVLAIASGYEYIIDGVIPLYTNSMIGLEDPGYKYYRATLPFTGVLINNRNLHSAQTLLLIGVFLTTSRYDNSTSGDLGYAYLSLSCDISISIGLHKSSTYSDCTEEKREYCKRLWWTCYTLERRQGINMGKVELIKAEDIDLDFPKNIVELQKSDGSSNYLNQIALIKLTFIFQKILNLYNKCSKKVLIDSTSIKDLFTSLSTWKSEMHEASLWENLDPNDDLYRGHVHLHLYYYLVQIYICKPFLLYAVEFSDNFEKMEPNEILFIQQLATKCVDAAYSIIQILSTLKDQGKIGIYSSTDLNSCNVSLYVVVVFLRIDKSKSTRLFFTKGMNILETLSVGCLSARATWLRLKKLNTLFPNEDFQLQKTSETLLDDFSGCVDLLDSMPSDQIELASTNLHLDQPIMSLRFPETFNSYV